LCLQQASTDKFIVTNADGEKVAVSCPAAVASTGGIGALCKAGIIEEKADFWRDKAKGPVSATTEYYECPFKDTCINGTECATGHEGPLCAVCRTGYAMQFGLCVACPGQAAVAAAIGQVLGVLAGVGLVAFLLRKQLASQAVRLKKLLVSDKSKSLVKVVIGFYTLVGCMRFTFGVKWPAEWEAFIKSFDFLTLDLASLSGFFCSLKGFNYYDMLLAATNTTMVVAAVIGCRWFILRREKTIWKQHRDDPKSGHAHGIIQSKLDDLSDGVSTLKRALFYMAIFLYPVLNLRIFQAFVCTDVSGVRYLRCDYRCGRCVFAYSAGLTCVNICVALQREV
jgi:hypothetical protein